MELFAHEQRVIFDFILVVVVIGTEQRLFHRRRIVDQRVPARLTRFS